MRPYLAPTSSDSDVLLRPVRKGMVKVMHMLDTPVIAMSTDGTVEHCCEPCRASFIRLASATHCAIDVGLPDSAFKISLLSEPARMSELLTEYVDQSMVTGTLDRRLVFIKNSNGYEWTIADLAGSAHATRQWPAWTRGHVEVVHPSRWLSRARLSEEAVQRLQRPRLLHTSRYPGSPSRSLTSLGQPVRRCSARSR